MCGRYALGIRASFVRHQIQQQGLPVDEAPDDDDVRQSYNFPPGSFGLVYRADVPDRRGRSNEDQGQQGGSNQGQQEESNQGQEEESDQGQEEQSAQGTDGQPAQSAPSGLKKHKYQLQAMKWGLIPFWTKRFPDYGSMLRTINCRDDSLMENRGLWNTMKQRKRCVVLCQGFYEWLKKGPGGKERVPHFVKRTDGQLMCFAGLWDVVKYEDADEKLYTYTIITTESNKQLRFLHDRMPVILDAAGEEMQTWLDPERDSWSKELQSILQPYRGELECYAVSKDVGKVGNNSPDFILPIDSKENKKNIANFFGNARKSLEATKHGSTGESIKADKDVKVVKEEDEARETKFQQDSEDNAPAPVPQGVKRERSPDKEASSKAAKTTDSQMEGSRLASTTSGRKMRSATSNPTRLKSESPKKSDGSQRITSFFGK